MFKKILLLALSVSLAACGGNSGFWGSRNTPPEPTKEQEPAMEKKIASLEPKEQEEPAVEKKIGEGERVEEMALFNSDVFDMSLSNSLKSKEYIIIVKPTEDINVNRMPERIEKWLAAVKEKGGSIKLIMEKPPQAEPDKKQAPETKLPPAADEQADRRASETKAPPAAANQTGASTAAAMPAMEEPVEVQNTGADSPSAAAGQAASVPASLLGLEVVPSMIEYSIKGYDVVKKNAMYSVAKAYNAILCYKDKGNVTKIIFFPKNIQQ